VAGPIVSAEARITQAPLATAAGRRSGLARDNRDVLFLLVVIGWTVAPHAARLPAWATAFAAIALLWRGVLAWRDGPLPSRFFLGFLLLLSCALTWWSHRTLLGQEPGVTLVVALTALKTLELRARRDAFVVFFLGFFLILTQFLYSQSLLTAAAMLLAVWGLLTSLTLANLPVGRPRVRDAAALAARTAALGAPIMVVLFMLFPRLPPLWGRPQDAMANTGLSGQMTLGQIAEMALDDSIAMRVRFLGGSVPSQPALYFRGPVLTSFDGLRWRETPYPYSRSALATAEAITVSGEPLEYEVTLEPTRQSTLPLLEATPFKPEVDGDRPPRLMQRGMQWQTVLPVTDRMRLRARAWMAFRAGAEAGEAMLAEHLELPAGRNPRTLAWARQLRADPVFAQADASTLTRAVLGHIRRENYRYTLSPGTYGNEAVDEFWFDRRTGFCEHFAAAYVVIMRAMGVPARVVTGFQGGELNPVDGYWIVRNSDAHAWAEYWQEGLGWVRVDPTAAVDPARVERGRRLAAPPTVVSSTLTALNPAFGQQLRNFWDAMNNTWNQSVLNYSQGRQLDVLRRLGLDAEDWTDLARALVIALTNLSLAALVWAWWERRRFDPWLVSYAQVRSLLESVGIEAAAHQPPLTLARLLRKEYGRAALPLVSELERLDALRYGPQDANLPRHPSRRQRRRLLAAARALVRSVRSVRAHRGGTALQAPQG
jgi:transglutaminase-like putative cysteine protease